MRRYRFLARDSVFDALNKLKAASLAAGDAGEVEEVIMGILTHDERIKIGRRIAIAKMLKLGFLEEQITKELKVGKTTVNWVNKQILDHPKCYEIIELKESKNQKVFTESKYHTVGGSKIVFKKRIPVEFYKINKKVIKRG